jgi:branched-chain amino acid transport system permease protein
MQEFFQQLINGLSLGAIYALIAVGYTMVYGVLQLINFAHGDVLMVGAMLVLVLARAFGYVGPDGIHPSIGGFLLCSLIAIVACGVLGFLIEQSASRCCSSSAASTPGSSAPRRSRSRRTCSRESPRQSAATSRSSSAASTC